MKKSILLTVACMLVWALVLTGYAAPNQLMMPDANAQTGQVVFLPVTLDAQITGDTMSITYSFDSKLLEAIPDSCKWEKNGILFDFNNKNGGVWTSKNPISLKGTVCTLAFRVRPDADFTDTRVSCTLVVMRNNEEVGQYQAQAKVGLSCSHKYGVWKDGGTAGHSRSCSLCGELQTQAHSWDEGKLTPDPHRPGVQQKTFTCSACGATKAVAVEAEHVQTTPTEATRPQATEPVATKPVTRPQPVTLPEETTPQQLRPIVSPTQEPTKPQTDRPEQTQPYEDYNAPTAGEEHNHETVPQRLPMEEGQNTPQHTHDHEDDPQWITAVAIAATVVVIVAGVLIYLKKNRYNTW